MKIPYVHIITEMGIMVHERSRVLNSDIRQWTSDTGQSAKKVSPHLEEYS